MVGVQEKFADLVPKGGHSLCEVRAVSSKAHSGKAMALRYEVVRIKTP